MPVRTRWVSRPFLLLERTSHSSTAIAQLRTVFQWVLLRAQQILLVQIVMGGVASDAAHVTFRVAQHYRTVVALPALLTNEVGRRLLVTEDRVSLVAGAHVFFAGSVTTFTALAVLVRRAGYRLLLRRMAVPACLLTDISWRFLRGAQQKGGENEYQYKCQPRFHQRSLPTEADSEPKDRLPAESRRGLVP